MLCLLYSTTSPFARKVRVAAFEKGLHDRISLREVNVWSADERLDREVTLGQVPVLLGAPYPLPGSTLICEYLDTLHGDSKLVPLASDERWRVWWRHALADGIMTAALAHNIELHKRPANLQWPDWLARQRGKIGRALAELEKLEDLETASVDLGTIAQACAIAYLDRRITDFDWRSHHPRLAERQAAFELRPSMVSTGIGQAIKPEVRHGAVPAS